MNKATHDFETWFDTLACVVQEETGITFRDRDSVRDDYEQGKNAHDVAQSIVDEYMPGDED